MGGVTVRLNLSGIRKLKRQQAVVDELQRVAEQVAGRVSGYSDVVVTTKRHKKTGVARVEVRGKDVLRQEADTGALARALGAGGGTAGL